MRKTQLSVTNFLYCGDEYLFMLRGKDRKVDAGRLNGIGGKLEKGEDYLSAAIRETKEETGFVVKEKDIELSGIVHLHEGYQEDWIACFFKIHVPTKEVPMGFTTPEGELLWLPSDKVLTSGYELVDDLYYCWEKVVQGKEVFFMDIEIDENEKVKKATSTVLALS